MSEAGVTIGHFMRSEEAARKDCVENGEMMESQMGRVLWIVTFPGGVKFSVDGQSWPPGKEKKKKGSKHAMLGPVSDDGK